MVRSTKLFPRTPSIASATIVGGISILFERQFSSPARKKGIPLAALWRFSLSLSRLYTWEPVQTLPFPSLISLHALLYPFSSFFSFPVPVSEDRARYTCHKAGCKPGFPRSLCRDVVK